MLRKLAGAHDCNRQMFEFLTAVLADGLNAVEVACVEAIAHGVPSEDVVLNILARQQILAFGEWPSVFGDAKITDALHT